MCSSMSNDINLNKIQSLIPPSTLKTQLPLTSPIKTFVDNTRNQIINILDKKDPRLLVALYGTCSDPVVGVPVADGDAIGPIFRKSAGLD